MKLMKRFTKWLVALLVAVMVASPALSVAAAEADLIKKYPDANMFDNAPMKGLQGAETNSLYGGLDHTLCSFFLDDAIKSPDSLWAKNGWIAPYYYEGEAFYFGPPPGNGYIPLANSKGMSISVVFLLRKTTDEYGNDSSFLIDPASNVGGYSYYAPNADLSTYGGRAMRAYWHYLMEWLDKNGYHLDNFILGNEVNMPNQWHYSGSPDGSGDGYNAATKYADAFWLMYSAVREYTDISRCSISLDHSWQNNNEGKGIAAKDFLHIFDERLLQYDNDVDWCVSTHLYPAQLFDTEIWNDPHNLAPNDSSARIIDGSNLNVMTSYIRDVFGPEHRVMLTEQGFSIEKGEAAQAACLAYSFYAAMYDPMVDCFILNTENAGYAVTGEGTFSLDFGINGRLAAEVYTRIGNGNEADEQWIANTCLPVIGASSWSDIVPNYGQKMDKTDWVDEDDEPVIDYSPVFDATYYYNNNSDIAGVIGNNPEALLAHFVACGMAEGRVASANFNVHAYREYNADLAAAFGDDFKAYFMHYLNGGMNEGRTAVYPEKVDPVYDYSLVFNAEYYYNNNPDIAGALGNDANALLEHFIACGMAEGRVASATFNVNAYREYNGDLAAAFGDDLKAYFIHYMTGGCNEGRTAVYPSQDEPVVPTVDYSAVFNAEYYYNNNPDVAGALGNDATALLNHFVACGMAEGRVASANFNVHAYKEYNPDVAGALGDDLAAYYMHYINYGQYENRTAVYDNQDDVIPDDGPVYDYSLVFDAEYYYNNNPDVAGALGNDATALLNHFVACGMSEGRVASANFNVQIYKANNGDLQAAFGDDWVKYFEHYMQCGHTETHRICK